MKYSILFSCLAILCSGCDTRPQAIETPKLANAQPKIANAQFEAIKQAFAGQSIRTSDQPFDCTLSGGAKTQCIEIIVAPNSADHSMGPWCPRLVTDNKDKAGIWLDKGNVHDVDGQFVKNLPAFYSDAKWSLYNKDSGKVNVTDSKEACFAAARPDVDPKYQNFCVECLPSYIDNAASQRYLIPLQPQFLSATERVRPNVGVGVALNGVKLDAPAPVQAILGAYTLAPFDDCGGHVNPHVGYHYHAANGCGKSIASVAGHANVIGVAMDGYKIHSQEKQPANLDVCGGHDDANLGYHYHAGAPGSNQIIACFKAQQGCSIQNGQSDCSAVARARPPR